MQSIIRFFAGSLLCALFLLPAQADITTISGGLVCGNPDCLPTGAVPVLQGKTTKLLVKGQGVNFADKNNVDVTGNGVSASITKDHLIAPGESFGTGGADVRLVVDADAAPGERTVTLRDGDKRYRFKILIVRNGRINSVTVPAPTDFFQTADVTFQGTRLGNSGVQLSGFQGTTAQVLENTESRLVVRLNFNSLRAEASGSIVLFDGSCRNCGIVSTAFEARHEGPDGERRIPINIVGPNAVKSITPPSLVTLGSTFTIRVDLVRPASAGRFGIPVRTGENQRGLPGLQISGPVQLGGETIHWQLAPSNVFEVVQGSGTTFDPAATLNQVRVRPGDTFVILTVRLRELPEGCPRQGCNVQIITRTGRLNSDQSPFFKSASFRVARP
ncbi:MAG TPA: hypothetical protein VFZ34_30280 [Blastocatellia bacterium]|nr:hypothetical protein [Blastocatellia bacterium]